MEITYYGFFILKFGALDLMGLVDPKFAIEINNRSQISDEVKDATDGFTWFSRVSIEARKLQC
jgi:hypothetical protein